MQEKSEMRKPKSKAGAKRATDPVVTEIVRNGVIAVTEEMKTNLMRTAYNIIIYEALDFTTALFTPAGKTPPTGIRPPRSIPRLARDGKAENRQFRNAGTNPGQNYVTTHAH